MTTTERAGGPTEERLWHPVPRLDSPSRLLMLPAHQARWLVGGLLPGLVLAGIMGATAWGDWRFWAVLLVGVVLGAVGAFFRPHGLHLGQWGGALLDFHATPKRAVWRPVGRRMLTW